MSEMKYYFMLLNIELYVCDICWGGFFWVNLMWKRVRMIVSTFYSIDNKFENFSKYIWEWNRWILGKGNEWVEGMFFLIALWRQIWDDKHSCHVKSGKKEEISNIWRHLGGWNVGVWVRVYININKVRN